MNSFGRIFRVSIFGESHGPSVGITVDGCPAGIHLSVDDFLPDLDRRKAGAIGTTTRTEADVPKLISGIHNGFSSGAPITILFENNNTRSADYETLKATPRPGHADFVLDKKHMGFNDPRGGGHSSGRLTVALVAAGVIAKKILEGTEICATLTEAGGDTNIERALQLAKERNDSIGGLITCTITGHPESLGEPFFDSIESLISHIVFAIPAVKGISFGSGFDAIKMTGLEHNDAIISETGLTKTNHAGGINGGITNGNPIIFKVAFKPTSSTPQEQQSWNNETRQVENFTVKGRHDLCIALRAPVVVEAAAAIALADFKLIAGK